MMGGRAGAGDPLTWPGSQQLQPHVTRPYGPQSPDHEPTSIVSRTIHFSFLSKSFLSPIYFILSFIVYFIAVCKDSLVICTKFCKRPKMVIVMLLYYVSKDVTRRIQLNIMETVAKVPLQTSLFPEITI